MKRNRLGALAALLVLAGVLVPPATPASAVPAPWTWTRVTKPLYVAAGTAYAERAYCPAGYTAITGGLKTEGWNLNRRAEYRGWDENGWFWQVNFRNADTYAWTTATVVAECARTADLPAFSYNGQLFDDNNGEFDGEVKCKNAGEVVVTGGVDWTTQTGAVISSNGPRWAGDAWRTQGRHNSSSAQMYVEVYCVDPAQVPGYDRVEQVIQPGSNTVTCPSGTRILSGGTENGYVNNSYPNLNTWTTNDSYERAFIRAFCVAAGTPTIQFSYTSPGPNGAVTANDSASFWYNGTDPAGFPNGFRCALDGATPTNCTASQGSSQRNYYDLATGPHQFVVFNETADGRRSGSLTYNWTIDRSAPAVVAPQLPRVSLADPVRARWSATDDYSGVTGHEAQFWLGRADGTTTGWTQPAGWANLTTPVVRLPALQPGDTGCISVRSADGVGNTSSWTPPTCTTRPLDDRALSTRTTGWTRGTGTQYWLETITQTTASGQVLRRGNVTLSQLGVVATVCPDCGAIDVTIGAEVVGRISLKRATPVHQKVITLPAFISRTGAVTITTVNPGKSIRIDGLVPIRTPATGPPS